MRPHLQLLWDLEEKKASNTGYPMGCEGLDHTLTLFLPY